MNFKRIVFTVFLCFFSAISAIGIYNLLDEKQSQSQTETQLPIKYVKMPVPAIPSAQGQPVDFRFAASRSTPAVVHVKTSYPTHGGSSNVDPFFKDFFGHDLWDRFGGGGQPAPARASGSGVIISSDGYIVTNNHVIDDANQIEVTLHNNKNYTAELIGKDKDTDLALLKIDENGLPNINFSNSDSVQIGEWVMAVGNPFNLSSTVTAGIVSAKGRNINILQNNNGNGANTAIESFIQTDAAVNPGNSGGALVNIRGELVGINTAIATPTGTFAGYSFAVPGNLVEKVVEDLKNHGTVQRGFLGVNIRSIDSELTQELELSSAEGVYLENILPGSAAEDADLQKGDIITRINEFNIGSAPELQEQVANFRPGDVLRIEFLRDGRRAYTDVTLKNKYNSTALLNDNDFILDALGLEVEELSEYDRRKLGITGGLKVSELKNGKLRTYTDIKEGFIITMVDDSPVKSKEDFVNILKNKKGNVMIEGLYPNRANATYLYAFKM